MRMWLALWANEHHIFEPSSTHSPLSRSALHCRAPTSDPASGSDIAMARVPPFATRARRSRFCSSVPSRLSAPTTISVTPYPAIGARPRVVSSRKSVASRKDPPEPPYSSSISSPYQPSSAICLATASSCGSSSRPRPLTSRSQKSRSAWTKSCCSSVRAASDCLVSVASSISLLFGRGSGRRALAVRRGRFVGLPLVQLAPGDDHVVPLVRAIGQAQHPQVAPQPRQRRVVGHAQRPVHLDRAIEHVHDHVRRRHLRQRDRLAGLALAVGVHLPRSIQNQPARGVDLDPRRGDEVLDELLLAQRRPERDALVRALAHQLERALGGADRAHAVV